MGDMRAVSDLHTLFARRKSPPIECATQKRPERENKISADAHGQPLEPSTNQQALASEPAAPTRYLLPTAICSGQHPRK